MGNYGDVVIRSEIWEAFFDQKQMSIDDLCKKIGRSRTEVSESLSEMILNDEISITFPAGNKTGEKILELIRKKDIA